MPDQPAPSLFPVPSSDYGSHYQEHLLEQYKLYVDSADRISQRRSSTNTFMLAVNASLVTLYGLAPSLKASAAWQRLVPIAGLLVCLAWLTLVQSYKSLNSAKFMVIHELEKKLPASPYGYEWNLLEKGEGKTYEPVTHIERWIPGYFGMLYVGLFIYSILS